jgi:hypothetical protein
LVAKTTALIVGWYVYRARNTSERLDVDLGELKTLGGKHAGHTSKDWSKISGDEDDGLFIKEGSKAEELVRAVLGANADLADLDTGALEGGRFMALPHHDDQDECPHACIDGWVYLGRVVESQHDLDGEVVEYERVPCRRCAQRS